MIAGRYSYSSLLHLHNFPFNTIKIDRSFVNQIGAAENRTQIVETIIALAQKLEMDVIAEGVETPEQLDQLIALGCRYAQGYLFAKPQPAEEMLVELKRANWLPEGTARTDAATAVAGGANQASYKNVISIGGKPRPPFRGRR